MAFLKDPTAFKRTILAFVKHIVTKAIYRAFDILLSPCCNSVLVTDTTLCGNGAITLTVSPAQPLLGLGFAQVFSTVDGFVGAGTLSDDGSTISLTATGLTNGAATFTATLFLPTDKNDSLKGVFQIVSGSMTVVTCP